MGVCVRSDLAAWLLLEDFFFSQDESPVSHFHMHMWFKRAQHETEPLAPFPRLCGCAGEVKRTIADRSGDPLAPLVNKSAGGISTSGACFHLPTSNRAAFVVE